MHISTFLSSAVDFVKEWIDSWYHQDFANDENNEMQQLLNAFYEKVNHSVVKSETIELTLRLDAVPLPLSCISYLEKCSLSLLTTILLIDSSVFSSDSSHSARCDEPRT